MSGASTVEAAPPPVSYRPRQRVPRFVLAAHPGAQKEISGRIVVFEQTPPLYMGSFLNFHAYPLPTLLERANFSFTRDPG